MKGGGRLVAIVEGPVGGEGTSHFRRPSDFEADENLWLTRWSEAGKVRSMPEEEYEEPSAPAPEEDHERPAEDGDAYVVKKDGKDPWKDSLPKQLLSWAFWLAMFYFATAGFIFGLMTQKDGTSNPTADQVFLPAEYVRDMSDTYRSVTDWQISLFRDAQELAEEP